MATKVSPQDRKLVEALMRVWNDAHGSVTMQSDPLFPAFKRSTEAILSRFGMEWDVHHGYVFPWTNRETGPFPMIGFEATVVQGIKT
jgi:hypothetical protein